MATPRKTFPNGYDLGRHLREDGWEFEVLLKFAEQGIAAGRSGADAVRNAEIAISAIRQLYPAEDTAGQRVQNQRRYGRRAQTAEERDVNKRWKDIRDTRPFEVVTIGERT